MFDKYICRDCGHIFEKEDAERLSECVGEFWGTPAYMTYDVCPECHSGSIEEYEEPSEDEEEEEDDT